MRRWHKATLALIALALWPFAQIGLIAVQAEYYAFGRPYCIQLSSERAFQYKAVTSLLQLNAFNLQAPYVHVSGSMGDTQFTFHAVLAVETGSGVAQLVLLA
jgi:hypothetical protein